MCYAARRGYTAGGDRHLWYRALWYSPCLVVDCPSRAPFRLLVARLIRWGVGDETNEMDEMDEADEIGKQRAGNMARS